MGSTADEELCLRWNDFESILSRSFSEMRSESDFFDVRIACFDESSSMKTVPAHKVVLSACSPVFKEILRNLDYSGNKGPLIFLRGIQYKDVEAVLDFMYNGQTKVQHTELDSFLAAAEELKIKGLTTSNNSSSPSAGAPSSSRKRNFRPDNDMGDMEEPKTSKGFGKRSRPSTGNSSAVEDVHIKSERIMVDEEGADESCEEFPEEGGDGTMYDETAYDDDGNPGGEFPPDSKDPIVHPALRKGGPRLDDLSSFEDSVRAFMRSDGDGELSCSACSKIFANPKSLANHVELKHLDDVVYRCLYCDKDFKSKSHRAVHVHREHRAEHRDYMEQKRANKRRRF